MNLLPTLVVVVAVGLVNLISAQDCNAQEDEYGQGIVIYSQDQLDALTRNCTRLYGDLVVGSNYTGSFIMHNLTNLTSSISVLNSTTGLTSLEAPDLVTIYGAEFTYPSSLQSISLPRLETAVFITIEGRSPITVSIPNLRNVSYLDLSGSSINANLSSLEQITTGSSICGEAGCDKRSSSQMHIDLPALRGAASLSVGGNISSLSLPVLASAGNISQAQTTGYGDYSAGLAVHSSQLLNFSVPALNFLNGTLSLRGAFDSISAPSLKNATGDIALEAWYPLAVNLSSLQVADDITLIGAISSTDFSSLKQVNKFSVDSTRHLNCDKVLPSNASFVHAHCNSAPQKKSALARNIGIGVGVGLGASMLLAVAGICIYRRRQKRTKKRKDKQAVGAGAGEESTHELQPVGREGEEGQGQSRDGSERAGEQAPTTAATQPSAAGVPAEPPPPYSRY
ncbi:uncharacterized protein BO97DRAFT_408705 [Aspergillus homomorphus CBS 101889]|uniref:Uncharacterized protein n=1 Tax=Aspergillus homomorphus (strain CBS 101889) TaxID=1450537 RepID=A0A395HIP2_ASPHC|nr:hypothetical protein BO97DRAFT_408705 [Aspergillus homomorphus CBS 101889]RAL07791.1 hypothetical protein BO97DRAFT_408705 [Aspergillus homomorphus CBS 101889]